MTTADYDRATAAFDRIVVANRRAYDLHRALDLLATTWLPHARRAYSESAATIMQAAAELHGKVNTANHEQYEVMGRENQEPWSVLADEADALATGAETALAELAALVAEHAPTLATAAPVKKEA